MHGQADVLRLDLLSSVGRTAASEYGVKIVPTALVFDTEGQIVLRQTGMLDPGAIRAKVAELRSR